MVRGQTSLLIIHATIYTAVYRNMIQVQQKGERAWVANHLEGWSALNGTQYL
jgi:hypothetical protein